MSYSPREPRSLGTPDSRIGGIIGSKLFQHEYGVAHRNGSAIPATNLGGLSSTKSPAIPQSRSTRLTATCWCERGIVEVTSQEVFDGITHSCGREKCKPPEKKEVVAANGKTCDCGRQFGVKAVRIDDRLTYMCEQCEQRVLLSLDTEHVWNFDRYDEHEEVLREAEAKLGLAIPARMRETLRRPRPVTMPWSATAEMRSAIDHTKQMRAWSKISHVPQRKPLAGFYCSCGYCAGWAERVSTDDQIKATLDALIDHLQAIKDWRHLHSEHEDEAHGSDPGPAAADDDSGAAS